MQGHCPICGQPLGTSAVVCEACHGRIDAREPRRRAAVLYGWGRGLMLFLALFLFAKGAYATLSPGGYAELVGDLGFASKDPTAQNWTAAFALVAALLYAIAWVAGYLGRGWDVLVCLAALVAFVMGQGATQFVLSGLEGGIARAIALFVFWTSVPTLQYYTFVLGRGEAEQGAGAAGDAAP